MLLSITMRAQLKIIEPAAPKVIPCSTDTVKGILYRSREAGSYIIETGYYIAKCGGIQIGAIPMIG